MRAAERAVVGAALKDGRLAEQAGLPPSFFADPLLGDVWDAVLEVQAADGSVDVNRVATELERYDIGDSLPLMLEDLQDLVADRARSDSDRNQAVSTVRRAYADRLFALELSDKLRELKEGKHAEEILGGLQRRMLEVQQTGKRPGRTLAAGITEQVARIAHEVRNPEERRRGLPLPWGLGPEVPGGCPRGKVTLLVGPTGTFKSTVANGWIRHWAQHGDGTIVKFGLEDPFTVEVEKYLSAVTGIPYGRIIERDLTEAEVERLRRVDGGWTQRIEIIEEVTPTVEELIRAYRAVPDVSAVVYDYAQMLDWGDDNERVALHKLALAAHRAGKADLTAQVLLSQIREDKQAEAGNNEKRPKYQWVFGGSSVYKTAKLIVGLYRPWSFFPNGPSCALDKEVYGEWYNGLPADEKAREWKSLLELVLLKNQAGDTQAGCPVHVELETGDISEW